MRLRQHPRAASLVFPTALDVPDTEMDSLQTAHGKRALAAKRRAEALTNRRRGR